MVSLGTYPFYERRGVSSIEGINYKDKTYDYEHIDDLYAAINGKTDLDSEFNEFKDRIMGMTDLIDLIKGYGLYSEFLDWINGN